MNQARVDAVARRAWNASAAWLRRRAGGPARARVIVLLACVLALDSADGATVGAVAGPLEKALHISNAQLGLLAAVPSVLAALATLPVGILTDRTQRVRLMALSILLWALAMAASGLAQSFEMLLITRMALGAVTTTAGPTLASLVGDFFPGWERGRIYGFILSGELLGGAFGFLVAGEAASVFSWRGSFFVLALPSLALTVALFRLLPEPARGGASRLSWGAEEIVSAEEAPGAPPPAQDPQRETENPARREVRDQRVRPQPELVLKRDPRGMSTWQATRYVLSIRTNVILIITSALGYFYFQGVQTFGLVFFQRQYRLSHAAATLLIVLVGLGALVGVQVGGRVADRMLERGRINGRIVVGAISYVVAALLFLPALSSTSVFLGVPLYILAGLAFAARNPPLDAARLDIMHSRLWGRAEAVRTLLRRCAVAAAPLSFGLLADGLATGRATAAAGGYSTTANAHGLELAFLVLLITLAAGDVLTFRALRTYPRDVATAGASEERTRRLEADDAARVPADEPVSAAAAS
jgi:MFS family permease